MNKLLPFIAFSILLLVPVGAQNAFAITLFIEDFEGSPSYVTSVDEFTDGGTDYFLRTDGTNISPNVNFNGVQGTYFAAQDLDGEGGPDTATLTFTGIPVSGCQDIEFSGLFAEDDALDGNEDWDADADLVVVEYQIDGNGFQNLLTFAGNNGINSEPSEDTDFDDVGDGTSLTDTFTQFSKPVSGSGNVLDLLIILVLDAEDEDIAFDNITILCDANGVIGGDIIPIETTSLLLAGSQTFSWMIPVLLSGIGIGLVFLRRK